MADVSGGFSLARLFAPQFTVLPSASGAFHGPRAFDRNPDCPTLSENPPTDTDGDRIPDDLTITYDPAKCTFGDTATSYFQLSGAVQIQDPSATDPAIRVTFLELQSKLVWRRELAWLRLANGPRQLLTSDAGFSASDSTTVKHESSRHGSAELAKAWQVDFVADEGAVFEPRAPLPSGDLTIDGATSRTWNDKVRSFTVSTPVALHFDAACDADDKITSGELHAEFVSPRKTATLTVVWNGCGVEPTVTFESGPVT